MYHHQQQPFFSSDRFFSSTIESNPSDSSKDKTELDQTNCDTTLPLPLPLSLFQFPYSPFEDNEIFLHHHHHDGDDDLFLHHHHPSLAPSPPPPPLPPHETSSSGVVNMEVSITTTTKVIPPKSTPTITNHVQDQHHQIPIMRRRSSKRDRHSKIKTARGLRDRRMRLSLDVAKRFFGLQDMLGFDKASKTVEWLLNQAKSEIKQLAREKKNHPSYDNNNNNCSCSFIVGDKSASSTSECIEGVSSLDEVAVSGNQGQEEGEKIVPKTSKVKKRSRTDNRLSRKSAFNTIGKESREKARERARERTREKMMRTKANYNSKQCNSNEEIVMTNNNHSRSLSRLGSWNPFESTVEESRISVNPSSFDVFLVEAETEERSSSQAKDTNNNNQNHHLGNCCVDDDSFVIMSRWSPTMILNSLNNPAILQEHQFAEFQSIGKPWEPYNNHI